MKRILSLLLLSIVASATAMMYAGTPVKQSDLPKTVLLHKK